MKQLTKREIEIIDNLKSGLSRKEIASELFLSNHTVNSHVKNIYRKLEISKVTELFTIDLPFKNYP